MHWRQGLDAWKENGEGAIEKKYAQSFCADFLACFGISATRNEALYGFTWNTEEEGDETK